MSETENKKTLTLPEIDKISNEFIDKLLEDGYGGLQILEITKECQNRIKLILSLCSLNERLNS